MPRQINRWGVGLRSVAAGLVLAAGLTSPSSAQAQEAAYRNHDELTRELRSLVDRSDAATMTSITQTVDGRDVWVIQLANGSGTPLGERPALLVVANLEGDHLVGSSHALEMIRYVLDNASEAAVQEMLAEQVVYVIPRLNPDGAEAMFGDVQSDRIVNANPYDDDNDGRVDEDGPDDLNGDGFVTLMRVKDPAGRYRVADSDSRLMIEADAAKGESGEYTLYWEGLDNDGDGFINEDGPGGIDLNRNFQHVYPYYGAGAGPHMVSELETRGLMDFMTTHRNIGAVFTFGHSDNVVTPPSGSGNFTKAVLLDLTGFADASNDGIFDVGVFSAASGGFGFRFGFGQGSRFRGAQPGNDNDPSSGRRPSTTVVSGDQEYFKAVSEAYKEITGIERVPLNRKAEGAFFQYAYFQFGVPSFSTQGWALPEPEEAEDDAEAAEDNAGAAEDRAEAADNADGDEAPEYSGDGADADILTGLEDAGVEAFVDWTTVTHPTLGEVEVGGFLPYVTTNPSVEVLAESGRKHGEFLTRLAGMLPSVSIVDTEVTAHGGGVFTVEVEIQNAGFFPTSLEHGVVSRSVQPTTVQIGVDPEAIVTGDAKSSTTRRLEGSNNRESFTWVIRGQSGANIEIRVRSQKGGSDSTTVTLR